MATTPLGIPYFAGTDPPAGMTQGQAQATAIDGLLTARPVPVARYMTRTAGYTIPHQTWSAIVAWDNSSVYNVGGITYGSGLLTVPVAGLYEWELTIVWPSGMSTSSHERIVKVEVNSSVNTANRNGQTSDTFYNNSVGLTLTHSGTIPPLSAGDQVQPWFYQDSGSSVTCIPSAFTLRRVA